MDILKDLYFGTYDPSSNFTRTPEYQAAVKNSTTYLEKVSDAMSPEFAEELWNAQAEITILDCEYYYRKGFRLGFQMALEGMSRD